MRQPPGPFHSVKWLLLYKLRMKVVQNQINYCILGSMKFMKIRKLRENRKSPWQRCSTQHRYRLNAIFGTFNWCSNARQVVLCSVSLAQFSAGVDPGVAQSSQEPPNLVYTGRAHTLAKTLRLQPSRILVGDMCAIKLLLHVLIQV